MNGPPVDWMRRPAEGHWRREGRLHALVWIEVDGMTYGPGGYGWHVYRPTWAQTQRAAQRKAARELARYLRVQERRVRDSGVNW